MRMKSSCPCIARGGVGCSEIGGGDVEYKNEMLDALVGKPVVVGLVKAPDLDEDSVESMREDPTFGMTEVVQ